MRALLEQVEAGAVGGPVEAPLAYLAVRAVPFPEDELGAACRRALLVAAAGGDPRRELGPESPAVTTLAGDLDDPALRGALSAELRALRDEAAGLEAVSRALAALVADSELAWRWACCALLAEELG